MASDLRGYTEQETLNKVLNTDNDSIQVDIVDATGVTITATDASVYVDDADWTDSTSSHTLVGGLYQSTPQSITDGDVGPFQVDADGALHISDGGNTITVDGTVTANLGSTDNTVLDNIAASLAVLDDWDDSNLANVNINIAGSDIAANAGTMSAQTPRVTIATDDTHFGAVGAASDVDGVVHGQLRYIGAGVDTVEASANAIQTAVELIDDTVAVLGTATYSETSTKGSVVGVVRNDTLATLADTDNEVAPLQVNAAGALYTSDASGEAGSIFVSGTNAITTTVISNTVFVAIQFITDTVFNSGNTGLVSATDQLYPSTQYLSTSIDADDGAVVDGVTFPQGMTIFGRWSGFQLASGKVIAYIGYV